MIVRYLVGENPCFVFNSCDVPAEHFLSYGFGTCMFEYLDSHLSPSDIQHVVISSDGNSTNIAIFYKFEFDETFPSFDPILDDFPL